MQETTEEAILRIDSTLERIETILKNKNKTTNKTRIGALNRISNAVGEIDFLLKNRDLLSISVVTRNYHLDKLDKIRNILLGIEGG